MTETVDPVAGKTVSEIFGEIVWLLTQDANFRDLPLSDLESLVMAPILLRQFHITYTRVSTPRQTVGGVGGQEPTSSKETLQPVAVEMFAMLPESRAAELNSVKTESGQPIKLPLTEWRSGPVRYVTLKSQLRGFQPG